MDELIYGLKKSQKKQFFYLICRIILLLTIFLPIIFLVEILLMKVEIKFNIQFKTINAIVASIIFFNGIFLIRKKIIKQAQLNRVGREIEVKFSEREFVCLPPTASMPGKYTVVGYYIQNNVTYRFKQLFFEDQLKVYSIIRAISEKGRFPTKVYVKVDPTDFQNYRILGYEFLEETLKINEDIVEQELYKFHVL